MGRFQQSVLRLFERKGLFLAVLLSLNFLLHFPFLLQPPSSVHVWRQCNTLAAARNFYEEDMNILRPRVDRRFDTDGVTGMQFPSFEYGVALLAKVFGFHDGLARILNLLIFSLGLWAFYELFYFIFQSRFSAAAGAWVICWSPELFYHSINALPDVLALCCSVGGLVLFLKWVKTKQMLSFWFGLVLITLAGLTKLQYLAVGFPIAVVVLQQLIQRKFSGKEIGLLVLFGAVSVSVPLAWYAYAKHLIEVSGLADFGLELRPVKELSKGLLILKDNLISDLPELLLNYAGFVLLAIGIFTLFKQKKFRHSWFLPVAVWSGALLAYHLIELSQMDVHQYYMLPYMPVLGIAAIAGANFLKTKHKTGLLIFLLAIQPVLASIRIMPRWLKTDKGVPAEFSEATTRSRLENAVPNNALCIVGPDVSGCIHFYYLHKKGFGFNSPAELFEASQGKMLISEYISRGAKYLYTNDQALLHDPRLKPFTSRQIDRTGTFAVLELKN